MSTEAQDRLIALWEEHIRHEFATKDTEETLATMVEDAYVNHVPVMTGGSGHAELRAVLRDAFHPEDAARHGDDADLAHRSAAISWSTRWSISFTHSIEMDWMLPGIAPTGKRVEVALVVIVRFRDGKLAHEHIYWDQASVLAQLGLIDAGNAAGRRRRERAQSARPERSRPTR